MKYLFFLIFVLTSPWLQAAPLAFITNQGEHTVSVIDIKQQKVFKTIPVGKAPVGVVTAPKLGLVFISNVDSQDVSVIDSKQLQVIQQIAIGGSPVGLALSPDETRLFVADWTADRVHI